MCNILLMRHRSSTIHNVIMLATTNSPLVSKNDQFPPHPPLADSLSLARYEALTAGISRCPGDDVGPMYLNVEGDRRAAAADDYKPAVMMSQLMPLYATHRLHSSISAYQHQLQQHQPSSYIKTESTTCERSNAQGRCHWTMKFVIYLFFR